MLPSSNKCFFFLLSQRMELGQQRSTPHSMAFFAMRQLCAEPLQDMVGPAYKLLLWYHAVLKVSHPACVLLTARSVSGQMVRLNLDRAVRGIQQNTLEPRRVTQLINMSRLNICI